MRQYLIVIIIATCFASVTSLAASLNTELVRNGDAELGSTDGWVAGGIGVVPTSSPGKFGLPPRFSIGAYSFSGGPGLAAGETLTQDIDLSEVTGAVTGKPVIVVFRFLLQSRRAQGITDTARVTLTLFDSGDTVLTTNTWVDTDYSGPSATAGGDWEWVNQVTLLPENAKKARILLHASRVGGNSTDAYFDNISLMLFQMPFITEARPVETGFELTLVTTPGRIATLEYTAALGVQPFAAAVPAYLAPGTGYHITNLIDTGAVGSEFIRTYRVRED